MRRPCLCATRVPHAQLPRSFAKVRVSVAGHSPLIGSREPPKPIPRRKVRAILLHLAQISMFVTTLVMIRIHHQRQLKSLAENIRPTVTLVEVQGFFAEATAIADQPARGNSLLILNAGGEPLGYVLQTSPESDSIIGFSGPTNVLLAFDKDDQVVGSEILWSRDEHLDMILYPVS